MSDNKDYSEWGLDELMTETKKIKRLEITAAVMIGFLAGIMIYGVANGGFGFIYTVIPVILIIAIVRNGQNLKQNRERIQAEINAKNTR